MITKSDEQKALEQEDSINQAGELDEDIEGASQPSGDSGASNSEAGSDAASADTDKVAEHGGPKGLEPTRYGDWEANGRCYDF